MVARYRVLVAFMAMFVVCALGSAPAEAAWQSSSQARPPIAAAEGMGRAAAASVARFVPVSPKRLLDTRTGSEPLARSTTGLTVTGVGGVPASAVAAVVVNLTVVGPAQAGYALAWPAGATRPTASAVNYSRGQTVGTQAIVKVGTGGQIDLYTLARANLLVDVTGYYPTGSAYTALTPARVLDTRTTTQPAAGSTTVLTVTGRGGVPASGVGAVVLSVTAVGPSASGFLTVWPAGLARPTSSNVNYRAGQTSAGLVLARIGSDGKVDLYTWARANLVVDVAGWIPTTSDYDPLTPARILDTRTGSGALRAGGALTVQVTGRGGMPRKGQTAVEVNVTAVSPTSGGWLTAYATGTTRPATSTLNFAPGGAIANSATVRLSASGQLTIYTSATTNVLVDVAGAWLTYPGDWYTYHGDTQRTGVATTAPVTSAPVQVTALTLDGAVYASPLALTGTSQIVATENDTVYRIDGGVVTWKQHLGTPVRRSALPCGNIDPLGITGTPAYDVATDRIVVVGEVAGPIHHQAWGLDPTTGAVRWTRNVDVPTTVTGITPAAMQQRGALTISGGVAYIPYGGLAGDCSTYRGSVVGVRLTSPSSALWHVTVPTGREAGIWTPPGPTVDTDGTLLVAVGNGESTTPGAYDFSDSILRLGPQATIVDSFSPSTWASDNAQDLDLGSQGPAIVGNYVYADGKSGTAYVLRRSALGGIGGEVSQAAVCRSFGGTAVSGDIVYVPCTDGVRAVRISASGTMTVVWHAATNVTGSPVLANGVVLAVDSAAGALYVLNQATGATRYVLPTGPVSRFATPAVSNSTAYLGTMTGVRGFAW